MNYRELNKEEAKKIFAKLQEDGVTEEYFGSLDSEYKKVREELLELIPQPICKSYDFDLKFGIKIFEYFSSNRFPDFNEAVASNYGFWRYISLKVIPDIVIERHGLVESYFFEKNVRIYIATLWWFINMSYQGDLNSTYDCLKRFSTDYILQFVERPGREGMYLEVVRAMFKYLSKISIKQINEKKGGQILIRRLLIQYTATSSTFNLVVENKVDEYVKGLFLSCGVEV